LVVPYQRGPAGEERSDLDVLGDEKQIAARDETVVAAANLVNQSGWISWIKKGPKNGTVTVTKTALKPGWRAHVLAGTTPFGNGQGSVRLQICSVPNLRPR
jgi:hypothetical protein